MKCADCLVKPGDAEALTRCVGPLEKSVGNQDDHVAHSQLDVLGRPERRARSDTKRDMVGLDLGNLIFGGLIEKQGAVSSRENLNAGGYGVEQASHESDETVGWQVLGQ